MNLAHPLGAIASVALSHPDDCECIVCRAADGDQDAFLELTIQLGEPTSNE